MSNKLNFDNHQFAHDVSQAFDLMSQARRLLEPYLTPLSESQRKSVLRAPDNLPQYVEAVVGTARRHEDVCQTSGFDCEEVLADDARVRTLRPLATEVAAFNRDIADTVLVGTAEVYVPVLALRGVARKLANLRPELGEIIRVTEPLVGGGRPKKS